jgi:adenosylcobinamide-GDP ribazoletransferase
MSESEIEPQIEAQAESNRPRGTRPLANGAHETAAGFIDALRLAFSFLTILPVLDSRPASEEMVGRSFAWFPIVGFILGLALCGVDVFLALAFGPLICSLLVVLALTVVTGGVHLDGLADTADALGAGRDRARSLEILRDSRVGSFGAIAIFFDLALKVAALASLTGLHRYAALILAPGLARLMMVEVTRGIDYLRDDGAGSTLLRPYATRTHRLVGPVTAIVLAIVFSEFPTLIVAPAVMLAMRAFYRRWLGGVTGDLIGACGELVEIAVLLTIAA